MVDSARDRAVLRIFIANELLRSHYSIENYARTYPNALTADERARLEELADLLWWMGKEISADAYKEHEFHAKVHK